MRIYIGLFALFVSLLNTIPAYAQNDECDTSTLANLLADYAEAMVDASYEEILIIADDIELILTNYSNNCSPTTPGLSTEQHLFNVKATGNVNIRSCGDTNCSVVAVATSGQTYAVVGQEGDWYQIELTDGETGFIASWLTARGPDEVIDLYDGYFDRDLSCAFVASMSRSRTNDFSGFAISGEGMNEVMVDIYRPNTTNPEPVLRQLPKNFIDSGELYIHQVYRSSYWPSGAYQISIERDGETRVYEFTFEQTGETIIYVQCD